MFISITMTWLLTATATACEHDMSSHSSPLVQPPITSQYQGVLLGRYILSPGARSAICRRPLTALNFASISIPIHTYIIHTSRLDIHHPCMPYESRRPFGRSVTRRSAGADDAVLYSM